MYIDGLTPAINSLAQWFHDIYKGCTHIDVVKQASSEEDALRTQTTPHPAYLLHGLRP